MKQIQEPIDTVLDFIKDLKATWEQAISNSNNAVSELEQEEAQGGEGEKEPGEAVYDA